MDYSTAPVQSIAKAMEILDILFANKTPMAFKEIQEKCEYPKGTLHGILSTLRLYQVVDQDEDGKYRLGIRLYEYGNVVSKNWDINQTAHPYLVRLANDTHCSAYISVMENNSVITIDQCLASNGNGLQIMLEIGTRQPLNATAKGKLFLSKMPDYEVERILNSTDFPILTAKTIYEKNNLLEEIKKIRKNGYATVIGEYKEGLSSIAAPIMDYSGKMKYALGIVGLHTNANSAEFTNAIEATVSQARKLSAALGYIQD